MRGTLARSVVLFLGVLMLAAAVQSDTSNVHNGVWWLGRSRAEKVWYVDGYVDGVSRAHHIVEIDIALGILKQSEKVKPEHVYDGLDFYRITYGQLADGLDVFYGDFRNKQILLDYAITFVRDQIRGIPAKELEIRLENMRQATTEENYDKE